MCSETRKYVKGCLICQQDKQLHRHPVGKLMPLPILHMPGNMSHDFGRSVTKKGYTAMLLMVDRLTKMTRFAPCKDAGTAH